MMFAPKDRCYRQSRFQFDICGDEDPLDVLVHEAHQNSSSQSTGSHADGQLQALHAQELARRCRNELSKFHKQQQEWDEARRRQALHRELDMFLDDATKSEMLDSATTSEINDLREKIELQQKEIESLHWQIDWVERAKADALYARDESNANEEAAALELFWCRQRIEQLEDAVSSALEAQASSNAHAEEALHRLVSRNGAVDKAQLEIQKLRGERDALRAMSVLELAELAETLMESLQRVQRAHQHKYEQRMDE